MSARFPHVLRRRRRAARRRLHLVQRLGNTMGAELERMWNRPALLASISSLFDD